MIEEGFLHMHVKFGIDKSSHLSDLIRQKYINYYRILWDVPLPLRSQDGRGSRSHVLEDAFMTNRRTSFSLASVRVVRE